jgi:hypothetical protein
MTLPLRCPNCGSTNVRGKHTDFIEAGLREYGCLSCGHFEDRRTDDPDYAEWLGRWRLPPGEATPGEAGAPPPPAPEKP